MDTRFANFTRTIYWNSSFYFVVKLIERTEFFTNFWGISPNRKKKLIKEGVSLPYHFAWKFLKFESFIIAILGWSIHNRKTFSISGSFFKKLKAFVINLRKFYWWAIAWELSLISCQKQPPEVFCWKGFLRIFTKFTRKHLCQSLFFNKVAGLSPATLLKQRLRHKCFPVNFMKFLRTPFIEHFRWLLLTCKHHTNY